MNLYQSANMGSSARNIFNRSSGMLAKQPDVRIKYPEEVLPPEVVQMLIKMNKNDEMEPSFVDTFSKFVLHNNSFDSYEAYGNIKVTTYSQFYSTLKSLKHQMNRCEPIRSYQSRFLDIKKEEHLRKQEHMAKQQNYKSGFKKTKSHESVPKQTLEVLPQRDRKKYLFTFEAYNNQLILVLDLSSYMLLYDYSTKSMIIQNVEEIIKDLFVGLQRHYKQRKNGDNGPSYFISCYAFSVYGFQIQEIMRQQEIVFSDSHDNKFRNRQIISDYICTFIHQSKLQNISKKEGKTASIGKIIQKVLNYQESSAGIKSLIVISAFKEIENNPYIFFSSNWYTYCFICAGQLNFGSFLIDSSQISSRFSKNPYFETKHVFKCKFYENWEKVRLIEREGCKFKYLDTSVQKSRAILYISCKGEKKQSIFDDILKFRLTFTDKKNKIQATVRSNESIVTSNKANKIISPFQFKVPVENMGQIIKTKYLQGWEQVIKENYLQNTKLHFKLQFADRSGIHYLATRRSDDFQVKMYYLMPENEAKQHEQEKSERRQIIQTIKKIDLINTSNFNIITAFKSKSSNSASKASSIEKKTKLYLNFDAHGDSTNSFNQILSKHDQWSSFFKVRKIYIQFSPNVNFIDDLNELLNEFNFLLGERISHLCFMQRKQKKQKIFDDIKEKEISRWNIIFIKVSGILRFIELKFGFLKFSDSELKQTIQNIENKLGTKKFTSGWVKIIPQDVYSYCNQQFYTPSIMKKSLSSVFQKTWKISFKNENLYRIFKYMNAKILNKLGYSILNCKKQHNFYFFKILSFSDSEGRKKKGVFLQISSENSKAVQFKLQVLPSFNMIPNLNSKDISLDSGSDRNLYDLTQKSIPSMSQLSISSNSLPAANIQSNNQIPTTKFQNFHYQSKSKNTFVELFNIIVDEMKQSQKKLLNLIKCYSEIYQLLIKKRLEMKKSGIESQELLLKIKEIYQLHNKDFEIQYLSLLQRIKKQSYNQTQETQKTVLRRLHQKNQPQNPFIPTSANQINIEDIPQPSEFLIQSEISEIKGDMTLSSRVNENKKFTFFLLAPNKVVYVWKVPNSDRIYYRSFSNIFSYSSPISQKEKALKILYENELKNRIGKQMQEEYYLDFYDMISQQSFQLSPLLTIQTENKEGEGVAQNLTKKLSNDNKDYLIELQKFEQKITSFVAVNLKCSQIIAILSRQKSKYNQKRMYQVLSKFSQKLFGFISEIYSECSLQGSIQYQFKIKQINTNILKKKESLEASFARQKSKQSPKQMKQTQGIQSQHRKQQHRIFSRENSRNQSQSCNGLKRLNYLFFEKKSYWAQEAELKNKQGFNFNEFESSVLKICTEQGVPINKQNIIGYFQSKSGTSVDSEIRNSPSEPEIQVRCFGYKVSIQSQKIRWLNQMLNQLVSQYVTYLNICTVSETGDIKEMENKISDYIIRGPSIKVPDDVWSESKLIRQIESGHMQKIIGFYQYSFTPFPAKFIARVLQAAPQGQEKITQPILLKYWLTLEITPARVIKSKIVPFKHLFIGQDDSCSYSEAYFSSLMDGYVAELFKFLRIRKIFYSIEQDLNYPFSSDVSIYINQKIYEKVREQKLKLAQTRNTRKKYKGRIPSNIAASSKNEEKAQLDNSVEERDVFKMCFLYQGEISYYPKFEHEQICNRLMYCEKLNSASLRNLDNTYIFFNYELKEHFIFYIQPEQGDGSRKANLTSSTDYEKQFQNQGRQIVETKQSINEKLKNKKLLYSVYCIDETVNHKAIESLHGGLLRKAIDEVTFTKVAKHLHINPSTIDEAEEEYFKSGQKWSFTIRVPVIEQKSNLRQYLKQHLQSSFYHKKTQFKSQIRKKELQLRQREQQQKQQQKNQSYKDITKISSKKTAKILQQECERRCVPFMWIFNTIDNPVLQQSYGTCMFLVKITIEDNTHSAANAMFWVRNKKQGDRISYIYPFVCRADAAWLTDESHMRFTPEDNIFRYLWHNKPQKGRKQSKKPGESFGKGDSGFYITSALGHSSFNIPTQAFDINTDQSIRYSSFLQSVPEITNQKSPTEKETQIYTTIKIEMLSYFGYPLLQRLQQKYQEHIFQSIYDYYLENRLFGELMSNLICPGNLNRSLVMGESSLRCLRISSTISAAASSNPNLTNQQKSGLENECQSLLLQRIESTPANNSHQSQKKSFTLVKGNQLDNRIYEALLNVFYSMQKQLPVAKMQSVTLHKTVNKVLIEDKMPVLVQFVSVFAKFVARNSKNIDRYVVRLVVYGVIKETKETYFWALEFGRLRDDEYSRNFASLFDKIEGDITKYGLQFAKIGTFFTDFLLDIDSLIEIVLKQQSESKQDANSIKREWQTSIRVQNTVTMTYDWMKKYLEIRSFCQTQYMCRRSLLIHFEVSDSELVFYSYNFKEKQVDQLLEKLVELELWYAEKLRLYNFIQKIKRQKDQQEISQYQIPAPLIEPNHSKKAAQQQFVFSHKDGKLPSRFNNNQKHEIEVNMTKLLTCLVFDVLPFKQFRLCKKSTEKMYTILSQRTVPYKSYDEYKGKQRSKLVRIGRQYLSIIRHYYGVERLHRKESDFKERKN